MLASIFSRMNSFLLILAQLKPQARKHPPKPVFLTNELTYETLYSWDMGIDLMASSVGFLEETCLKACLARYLSYLASARVAGLYSQAAYL